MWKTERRQLVKVKTQQSQSSIAVFVPNLLPDHVTSEAMDYSSSKKTEHGQAIRFCFIKKYLFYDVTFADDFSSFATGNVQPFQVTQIRVS